ncbi:Pf-fam-b protein [Plasmodium gonderi]|uniref:Pf-fam-b protein n=1 Tax=Plasmodium gonderi TaxID=77519 RepID=A0A1Y1JV27_PLAGO|nr:Pf-fam-b protein [Plasmodium gonderi]GAW84253.1 Pf-fam-b protein [Plasmodium gonderi]
MDNSSVKEEEYCIPNQIAVESSTSDEIEFIDSEEILLSDEDYQDYILSEQNNDYADTSQVDLTRDDEIIMLNMEDEDFMSTDVTMEYNEELEEITMNTMQIDNMVGEVLRGQNNELSHNHLNGENNEMNLSEFIHHGNIIGNNAQTGVYTPLQNIVQNDLHFGEYAIHGNIVQHDVHSREHIHLGNNIQHDFHSREYSNHGNTLQHDGHSREHIHHWNIAQHDLHCRGHNHEGNVMHHNSCIIIEFDRLELHYNYNILKLWETIKERRLGDYQTNPDDLIEDKLVYHIYNFFHSIVRCKYFTLKGKLGILCEYIVMKYNIPIEVKNHVWGMIISYILNDMLKMDARDYFELCDLIENGMCNRLKFVEFINNKTSSWNMSTNLIFQSWADVLTLKLISHSRNVTF